MQTSNLRNTTFSAARGLRPLRLLAVTAALALAGGLVQTAVAGPYGGGYGGHAAMGPMGGMGYGAMGGMGMGMGHPRQMDRLFDSIGATADQKTQIRQIWDAARTDLQAQREAGRALHEQARTLFTQPSVDANAAEALRKQMLAQHDQASKRMMQAMVDASRVLTPEQRKAIGERMNERRAMMERHRAERDSAARGKP